MPRIREALKHIPADDRYEWRHDVGGALHHASGGSEDGLGIFDEWSRTSPKYRGRRDIEREWKSFDGDHAKPKTLASLYDLARKNGWGGAAEYVALANSNDIPKAKLIDAGDMTTRTMARLKETFDKRNHNPSPAQLLALEDIARTIEAMAKGTAEPVVYLSSVDDLPPAFRTINNLRDCPP